MVGVSSLSLNGLSLPISVDSWGRHEKKHLYFLSHAHAGSYYSAHCLIWLLVSLSPSHVFFLFTDHTAGLTAHWDCGLIHCSPITARILELKFSIPRNLIVIPRLPPDELFELVYAQRRELAGGCCSLDLCHWSAFIGSFNVCHKIKQWDIYRF